MTTNWVQSRGDYDTKTISSFRLLYSIGAYFGCTIFTGVGSGDFLPLILQEKFISMVIMFCGQLFFAYLMLVSPPASQMVMLREQILLDDSCKSRPS